MKDCIAMARMMNLFYHHLHNVASGVAFEGDHEMMADFYAEMDDAYDSLIERHIGLGGPMGKSDFISIIENAHEVLENIPESDTFNTQLKHAQSLEIGFRMLLDEVDKSSSGGTKNLIEGLMDQSEVRSYKLGRRLA